MQLAGLVFISWLWRRKKVLVEKNLNWDNDRERHNNANCKRQSHKSHAAAPSKNCTLAICTTLAEEPAT